MQPTKNKPSSNHKETKAKRKNVRIIVQEFFPETGKTLEELMTQVILDEIKKDTS